MYALLFPGQGSQTVGMGRDAFASSEAARRAFETADEVLGLSLSKICFEGPEEKLRQTEIQQPAILTTSIAWLRALEEQFALEPSFVAGHSLGEYSALVACGALSFEDALRLVHARGRYMQEAVPDGHGAMAAVIGCDAERVTQACRRAAQESGEVVTPANFNAPQQTVIAGAVGGVERASELARDGGAKRVVALSVSAPFHCALMAPAAEKLAVELERARFHDARPPLVSNVEAAPNTAAERMPGLLVAQVTAPVRFTEMIQNLASWGVTRVLEVGPGRVLNGLVARIDRRMARFHLGTLEELEPARRFLSGEAV